MTKNAGKSHKKSVSKNEVPERVMGKIMRLEKKPDLGSSEGGRNYRQGKIHYYPQGEVEKG